MLKFEQLFFRYPKKDLLFKNLNLELVVGNIYGLLGKNAAGKTTLFKLIAGLSFPLKGDCVVFGANPRERSPQFLSDLYFLPEDFYLPPVSIPAFIKRYASFYPRFSQAQFEKYLAEFEIPQTGKLDSLSFGQQKKFLLTFGLATNTRLLLLDEPTNGLDIPSKSQFRKALAGSLDEDHLCIIATHQVRDLKNLIDPIIILDAGEIIFHQSLETISNHLAFDLLATLPPEEEILYTEQTFGGHLVVTENKTGVESNFDVEVLFNTVLASKEKINSIFNQGV